MRILYLSHRVPYPPNKGERIRAWRQLEYLGRRHEVWCACLADQRVEPVQLDALRAVCRGVAVVPQNPRLAALRGLWCMARGGTITEGYFDVSAMRRVLRQWTASFAFDAVVAFSSSMASYARSVPAARRVLDFCDVDSRKWADYARYSNWPASSLYAREAARLDRRERAWLASFDASTVITSHEAGAFAGVAAADRLHVINNGVYLDAIPGQLEHTEPPVVGFIGALNYRPNVDGLAWFARAVWPQVRHARPDAVFRVAGHSPVRRVWDLARMPGVEVVGPVPDARTAVVTFNVSVAPLRIARGLQNKVLEAMAAARPVVLTSAVARGIGALPGRDYAVADEPRDMAGQIVRLLDDSAARTRMGTSARHFVDRHHRWDSILAAFERVVTGVLDSRTARRRHITVGTGSSSEWEAAVRERTARF